MLASDTLLADVLQSYFRLNPRIRSPLTREQYTFAIRDFGESLLRIPVVADLNEEAIAGLRCLLQKRNLAVRTINERIGRLLTLWRWMKQRNLVSDWPTSHRIPEPHRVPQAWTIGQMQEILAALSAAKGFVGGIPEGEWWRSLILAMWDSGERITALMSSAWSQFDRETGWLVIPAENRKGQHRDGVYRMTRDTIDAINGISQPARELIWPWPFVRSYLWIRYRGLLRKAGMPNGRYSGFHRIRRTVASYYDAAGGDASRLLGHSDKRVTDCYLDPRITPTPQASDRLPRIG